MEKLISYENYKGGVNNLQVVRIVKGISTIKTFTSQKHLAEKRADRYIKKNI